MITNKEAHKIACDFFTKTWDDKELEENYFMKNEKFEYKDLYVFSMWLKPRGKNLYMDDFYVGVNKETGIPHNMFLEIDDFWNERRKINGR